MEGRQSFCFGFLQFFSPTAFLCFTPATLPGTISDSTVCCRERRESSSSSGTASLALDKIHSQINTSSYIERNKRATTKPDLKDFTRFKRFTLNVSKLVNRPRDRIFRFWLSQKLSGSSNPLHLWKYRKKGLQMNIFTAKQVLLKEISPYIPSL